MTETPKYRQSEWLDDELRRLLGFYYPACRDDIHGGFIAQFDEETGDVYDTESKHLVATTRFVVNFALAADRGSADWAPSAVKEGLQFLQTHQRDSDRGGYHWLLKGRKPIDSRRVCYGHAFALLALSRVVDADVGDAAADLRDLHALIDERFWEPQQGLYKSEYDADWSTAEDYRGQNANMHTCEAMIAAYEATGDTLFLDRAVTIAKRLTVDLTEDTDGLVWEHYTADWEHDFTYNRDDPTHTFRPWGYQPGHQIEWAKLLAVLARHHDADWLIDRARELFDAATGYGWDDNNGGLYYSFDRDGEPLVTDKYTWEIAEGIGAAAVLYEQTGEDQYADWYDRMWAYADAHAINPEHRNWYTKVTENNDPVPTTDGVAVEPGYHPIGACLKGIHVFGE